MRLSLESEIMKHSVPVSSGHAGLCKMHSPLIFFYTTNKLMFSFTISSLSFTFWSMLQFRVWLSGPSSIPLHNVAAKSYSHKPAVKLSHKWRDMGKTLLASS